MGDSSGMSNSYPPVGSPDRYDVIVQRGRALRRRRRYTLGAGAGGTVVAIAVAVVLITGNSNDVDTTEFADDTTTTTTTALTTTTAPPAPDEMKVTVDSGTSTVLVQDPAQLTGGSSAQCVYLAVESQVGELVAEGSACSDDDAPIVELVPSNGTEIACASVIERSDPAETTPTERAYDYTYFSYVTTGPLPPGQYEMTAHASSGIGDHCADPFQDATEQESVAFASSTIELR